MSEKVLGLELPSVIQATIRQPKQYQYKPKKDITTYELAQIIPLFNIKNGYYEYELFINSLPDNCKRHFQEV